VRASTKVGVPQTSGGEPGGDQIALMRGGRDQHLAAMWPHFFSDASWSSKCTPAAPASI